MEAGNERSEILILSTRVETNLAQRIDQKSDNCERRVNGDEIDNVTDSLDWIVLLVVDQPFFLRLGID